METGGKQLVSKSEYAKLKGWNRSYLSKKPVIKRLAAALETDADGKVWVNVAKANAIFARETDTAKVRKDATPASDVDDVDEPAGELSPEDSASLDVHRRRNIRLKNEDLALKLAKDKGETLPRAGVKAAAAQAGQTLRENLSALTPGLAERFSTMTDAREIRTAMDAALRECFESVMNEFNRKIQPAVTGGGQPTAH